MASPVVACASGIRPSPPPPAPHPAPADRNPAAVPWPARCAIPAARSRCSLATPRPGRAWATSRRIGPAADATRARRCCIPSPADRGPAAVPWLARCAIPAAGSRCSLATPRPGWAWAMSRGFGSLRDAVQRCGGRNGSRPGSAHVPQSFALRAAGDPAACRPACSFLTPLCLATPRRAAVKGGMGAACMAMACAPARLAGPAGRAVRGARRLARSIRAAPARGTAAASVAPLRPLPSSPQGHPPPAGGALGSLQCFATRVFRAPVHE